MNRSFANVLFGAFGTRGATPSRTGAARRRARPLNEADDIATCSASCPARVVIVPGYGMAVSQAQHAVRELGGRSRSAAST